MPPPTASSPLLIVASVDAEAQAIMRVDANNWETTKTTSGWHTYQYKNTTTLVCSGIGRANAAAATAWMLAKHNFNAVLNIGIAGALPQANLNLGDIILAKYCTFVEEGIQLPDGPHDMKTLGFDLVDNVSWANGNRMAPDSTLAKYLKTLLQPTGVHHHTIATVARCSGTNDAAQSVVQQTGAAAEAMEGAAVILAAQRLNTPAAELRIISNTCGNRDQQHWDIPAALQKLSIVIEHILTPNSHKP